MEIYGENRCITNMSGNACHLLIYSTKEWTKVATYCYIQLLNSTLGHHWYISLCNRNAEFEHVFKWWLTSLTLNFMLSLTLGIYSNSLQFSYFSLLITLSFITLLLSHILTRKLRINNTRAWRIVNSSSPSSPFPWVYEVKNCFFL